MQDQGSLKQFVRTIPDWPVPGVQFRDLTPLFANPKASRQCLDRLVERYLDRDVTQVAAIEARGFIFGAMLANELNVPLILVRKGAKLPGAVIKQSFDMEYGTRTLEISTGLVNVNDRVLIFDDLIATGGSALATSTLIKSTGASIEEVACLIDLPDLGGTMKLAQAGLSTYSLMAFGA